MIDELVAWLRTHLDADQLTVRSASPGPWRLNAEGDEVFAVDGIQVAEVFALSGGQLRGTAAHIAMHDPTRMLAEIESKRQHIARWEYVDGLLAEGVDHAAVRNELLSVRRAYALVIADDAVPYADRPGYRDAWRPRDITTAVRSHIDAESAPMFYHSPH